MRRKIRLDPDALRVQTFEMEISAREHGTVHAHGAASGVSCTYACTVGELTCIGPLCQNTVPVVTCLC